MEFRNYYSQDTYFVMEYLAAKVARPGMVCVDLGVFTGSSAFAFLPIVKANNGTAYLVDWFQGSEGTVVGDRQLTTSNFPKDEILACLNDNLKLLKLDESSIVIIGESPTAAEQVADESVDYIMVAADHRYTPLMKDIEAWWPKLRKGGVMAGHAMEHRVEPGSKEWLESVIPNCEQDFINNTHYGVIRAVTERFPSFELEAKVWWTFKE